MADETAATSAEVTEPETTTEEVKTEPVVEAEKTETTKEPETKPDTPEEEKDNHSVRRMKKFIADAAASKREAQIYKDLYEKQQQTEAETKSTTEDKPLRANFENDEDFIEALTDYKIAQRMPEIISAGKSETQQDALSIQHQSRVSEAYKAHPDFGELFEELKEDPSREFASNIADDITLAIKQSDVSGELTYYFLKNPGEVTRLNQLSIHQAVKELGKIEDKVAKPSAPASVTKAPAPIKPVSSRGSMSKDLNDPELSTADFIKIRNAQIKAAKTKR